MDLQPEIAFTASKIGSYQGQGPGPGSWDRITMNWPRFMVAYISKML